jgi:hypothetical protein
VEGGGCRPCPTPSVEHNRKGLTRPVPISPSRSPPTRIHGAEPPLRELGDRPSRARAGAMGRYGPRAACAGTSSACFRHLSGRWPAPAHERCRVATGRGPWRRGCGEAARPAPDPAGTSGTGGRPSGRIRRFQAGKGCAWERRPSSVAKDGSPRDTMSRADTRRRSAGMGRTVGSSGGWPGHSRDIDRSPRVVLARRRGSMGANDGLMRAGDCFGEEATNRIIRIIGNRGDLSTAIVGRTETKKAGELTRGLAGARG